MAFTSPISLTELQAAFDAQTATLAANAKLGKKVQSRRLDIDALADTTALSARRFAWTQTDDLEIETFALRVNDTVAGRNVTATLTVDGGDTRFLSEHTFSITLVSVNGVVDQRTDLRATTGARVRLKKGVRYILTVQNTSAGTTTGRVHAWVEGVADRRTA